MVILNCRCKSCQADPTWKAWDLFRRFREWQALKEQTKPKSIR